MSDGYHFRKLSIAQQAWLKLANKRAFREYRQQVLQDKLVQKIRLRPSVPLGFAGKTELSFRHRGNAGDIIYSLPCVRALAAGRPAHYHLHIDQPADYGISVRHPLGNVMMNRKVAEQLQPLLSAQPYISSCSISDTTPDVDLDLFRGGHLLLDRGHIARWYFLLFGVNDDLGKRWLSAAPDPELEGKIVLARSARYHMPLIRYDFLADYNDIVFVGLPDEYAAMKQMLPRLEYRPVNDFLELARVIAGSRLFIGNQSFPFSIAEGLKVLRLLEMDLRVPNVIVEGPNGYDFCYQEPFERLVHDLYYYGRRKLD